MTGIPSWAVLGAKVVCIKKGVWFNNISELKSGPEFRKIYEIIKTGYSSSGKPFICVNGFVGIMFNPSRFRPLVSKSQEQDVAMFKSLLHTAPKELENIE